MTSRRATMLAEVIMTGLVRRRPLVTFIVLAYLGSWIGWAPWWLSNSGVGLLPYELPMSAIAGINQLGLFLGPFTAALVVTGITAGRRGIGQLLRRLLAGRVNPGWYLLALLVIPIAAGVGYLVLSRELHPAASGGALVITLLVTAIVYIFGGPVQEEPGWRGVALPLLQRRFHPLAAAGILGLIHTCWHLPLALTREWDPSLVAPGQPVAYLVMVLGFSVVMSWLSNGTRGSLLLAVLGHNALNWGLFATETLVGQPIVDKWPVAIGMAVLAVIVIILTRARLGLRPRSPDDGSSAL